MKHIIFSMLLLFGFMSANAQRFGNGERAEKLKALWVAYVTQELDLSPDESAKFWPIFNEYMDKERALQQSKRQQSRKSVNDMSEAEIDAYFSQTLSIDEKIIALKREYYPKLKTAVPAYKIVKIPAVEREFKKKLLQMIQERRRQ